VSSGGLLTLSDNFLDLLADSFQRDFEGLQSFGSDTFALVDKTQEDVFGADVVVVEHLGFFLCQNNDSASPVGKPLKHVSNSSMTIEPSSVLVLEE
jgi:hypothetical protein